MKITDIKTWCVTPNNRSYNFLKIETDEGIYGIGEAYSCGPDLAVIDCIKYFKDWIIGQDPTRMEYIFSILYNYSRFPGGAIINSAISGIDLALWDIAGKAANKPVYKLAGGPTRDKVWCYTGTHGETAEKSVEEVQKLQAKYGYTAIKAFQHFSGTMTMNQRRKDLAYTFETYRKVLGDDLELCIDFHARNFEPFKAVWLAEVIKEYRPFFIEEPIRMENMQQMAALRPKLGAPLATGECLYYKYEFNNLLSLDAADILQPDILLCGGFTETKKIAAMAEANYRPLATHNPLSPLSTWINVHFAASIPNFLILETHSHNIGEVPESSKLVTKMLSPKNGYIDLPNEPGWGVDFDYDYLNSLRYKPWSRPFAKTIDGAIDVV
jgi:galactonate dehydratase